MNACEFCARELPEGPENVVFLAHVDTSRDCRAQFEHLLDNLRTGWASASGAA